MPLTAFTENTTPVAATTAGKFTPSAPCKTGVSVSNDTGVVLKVNVHSEGESYVAASDTAYDFLIPAGVSEFYIPAVIGKENIEVISIWVGSGGTVAAGDYQVRGR